LDKRNQGQKTTCAEFVFMDMLLGVYSSLAEAARPALRAIQQLIGCRHSAISTPKDCHLRSGILRYSDLAKQGRLQMRCGLEHIYKLILLLGKSPR
jgi:hypothetical protein